MSETGSASRTILMDLASRLEGLDADAATRLQDAIKHLDQEAKRAARQAFLHHGWARAALNYHREDEQEKAAALRGSRTGILVSDAADDPWAAQYQRLNFRRLRSLTRFGLYGTKSISFWGEHGFTRVSDDEIARQNRAQMASHRARAHQAKKRIASPGRPTQSVEAEHHRRQILSDQAAMMGAENFL